MSTSSPMHMMSLVFYPRSCVSCFAQYHNSIVGHHGVNATLRKLRAAGLLYPNSAKDLRRYIQHCPICQTSRSTLRDLPVQTLSSAFPSRFARIQIDKLAPFPEDTHDFRYIDSIICECTGFCELVATRDETAAESVGAINETNGRYGPPFAIRSDNGPSYASQALTIMPY